MPASLPRCFFDIAINGVTTGRVIFELYSDVVPKTTENFRCLCTGERGEGKSTFKPLHYKGTPIHRIVKGFIVQGGDFSSGDGTGGESIYGGMFKDEVFQHKHEKPFLLSMANKGPNTNGSQFFITTRPAPHLDGIHVVFGHVISGQQFVIEMENQKVDTNHRPYADVRITNSGELVRVSKAKKVKKRKVVELSAESSHDESLDSSENESEESSSDERSKRRKREKVVKKEKRKKRRREKKLKTKKKKKPSQSDSDSDSEESSVLSGDDHVTSTVVDEEEPPLPPELEHEANKSWLYRRSRTPSPVREEREKDKNLTTTKRVERVYKPRKKHQMSQSGRKLKGRGLMRYTTPPKQFDSQQRENREPWERREYRTTWRRSRSRSRDRQSHSRSRNRRSHSRSRDRQRRRSPSPHRRHSLDTRRSHRRDNPDVIETGDHTDKVSRSRERDDPSRERRRHRGSISGGSPDRSRRRRSSQDRRSPRRERKSRRRSRSRSEERQHVASKWARHRDSAQSSSDEEDEGLEKAYEKGGEEEDLFGLAKLSEEIIVR